MHLQQLRTPSVLVDLSRMNQNLCSMRDIANKPGVKLWPHLKIHKMREVWKRQRSLGAKGGTCAKISEVEALGEGSRIFLAYPLASPDVTSRIVHLHSKVEESVLAATSLEQFRALKQVLASARLPKIAVLLGHHFVNNTIAFATHF